ncbi:uncharacterized protein LOC126906841 [Daktulosphaira vitifoliae]|uniref:uncharacterized protein LOC126906841 n=1 Tax=Daktulosphaira vitifoliae TaxID=58002 RepID=UPI0021A9AE25|nr:uncharacterized protein LOC126906841 [Daktulosphaira vitifoliae]
MFSFKLVKFVFLLFSTINYTVARSSSNESIEQLDNLLKYSGWKNLNDLYGIKYYKKMYYLQDLIELPTNFSNCYQKIRALTVTLGCIYAKVMNNLFSIINYIIKKCKKKIDKENDLINGCICTEELINIISIWIVPIAILMKGAMDALDLSHYKPWATLENNNYMISPLLGRIQDIIDILKNRTLSHDDISTYKWTLNTINIHFDNLLIDVNFETIKYCELKPYNPNDLLNKWTREYFIVNQRVNLIFLKFLTRKIKDYIKTVSNEKYFQLGFKFDPITEETFIPTPKEPIEIELEFKTAHKKLPTPLPVKFH